jgi:predicted nuclease of restriction endonuclease-like (RecB) superfamily
LERLAERLNGIGLDEISPRYLRLCRRFSTCYPEIRRSLTAKSDHALLPEPIWRSLTAKFDETGKASESGLNTRHLLENLTFTHFEQLLAIDDPLKRAFYEIECIRGNWSVRALKRQIASLYFERSGLSLDKEKLSAMAHEAAETAEPKLSIRDPYIFEFLGLKPREAVAESDLEQSLLENLQDFLLELGHGFCLEARQKSILIGDTRGFVDHRYVPDRGDAEYAAAQTAIRRIAREGRKYGIGLMLVSQRPADVESTVISQCGTWLVLRLTNAADQHQVSRFLPDGLSGMTKALPTLAQQEAIFVGEGAAMPARVRIRDLTSDQLPKSDTAKFAQGWTLERLSEEEIKVVAQRMAGTQETLGKGEELKTELKPTAKVPAPVNFSVDDDSPF